MTTDSKGDARLFTYPKPEAVLAARAIESGITLVAHVADWLADSQPKSAIADEIREAMDHLERAARKLREDGDAHA